jgi:hypothetical protein
MESISLHHFRCSTYAEWPFDIVTISEISYKQLGDRTVDKRAGNQGGGPRRHTVTLNLKLRERKSGLRLMSGGSVNRDSSRGKEYLKDHQLMSHGIDREKACHIQIRSQDVPNGGLSTIT